MVPAVPICGPKDLIAAIGGADHGAVRMRIGGEMADAIVGNLERPLIEPDYFRHLGDKVIHRLSAIGLLMAIAFRQKWFAHARACSPVIADRAKGDTLR